MKKTKKSPKVRDMKPNKDAKGGGHPIVQRPHIIPVRPHPNTQ